MKITEKQFQIKQLTDNRNDYILEEKTFFFGIYLIYCYYALDGMGGDIPFTTFSTVRDLREELIRKEVYDAPKRENYILWSGFILLLILLTIL